jgi:hypothetical protein
MLIFSIGFALCPLNSYGQVGRDFRLRTFSAGSILMFAKQIAACCHNLAGPNAAEAINQTHAVNNCAGETGYQYYLQTGSPADCLCF